jgi:hypothetical protein
VPWLPRTRLGEAALYLAAAYFPLMLAWSLLPLGGAWSLASGAAGGVLAVVALRRGDRARLLVAAVVPLALVVLFVAGELLIGH